MIALRIAKFFCLFDAKKFAFRYFALATALSYVFNHVPLRSPYVSAVRALLDDYFAKYSVFAVVVLLLVLEFCVLRSLEGGKCRPLLFAALRGALNIGAFVSVNQILAAYAGSSSPGECDGDADFDSDPNVICVQKRRTWSEYRTCGHTYAAFYLLLVILEHAPVFVIWEQVDEVVVKRKGVLGRMVDGERRSLVSEDVCDNPRGFADAETLIRSHKRSSPVVKLSFSLLGVVAVLLHLDMGLAVLYYRHFDQKIVGILVAMAQWLVLYRLIYGSYDSTIDFDRGEILDYVLHLEQNTEKYNSIDEEEFEHTMKDDYRNQKSPKTETLWWSRLRTRLFGKPQVYDDL